MRLLKLLLILFACAGQASVASAEILPAEQSFTVRAERTADDLVLNWTIGGETYLYRDHIAVRSENGRAVAFSTPRGTVKDDPNFGPVEIFRQAARATIAEDALPSEGGLVVTFQGCTDAGLCYPPLHRRIDLQTLAVGTHDPVSADGAAPRVTDLPGNADDGAALLTGASLTWTLLAFLGFGLLLSLTPCVYPMVPILAGIIAGPGGQSPGWRRGLLLSSAYVLSMAAAYAVLGAAAAWSGVNLQAVLQAPWAVGAMAAILIAFGIFGAQLLPRSGPWLLKVREFFGFIMVGAAIVLIARIVPGHVALLLWAALMLAIGVHLGAFEPLQAQDGLPRRAIKAAGLLAIIYGGALTLGASAGATDPLRPLAQFAGGSGQQKPDIALEVAATVSSPEALDAAITSSSGKPVLVKFTADWCTVCKDIERDVLTDPAVRAALRDFAVIAADVTRDSKGTRELMKRLAVVGPPTLLVLDAASRREIASARITGATTSHEFIARLAAARSSES